MMADDAFSRWLGIEILDVKPGHVTLSMLVRPEMTNGFNVSHGGIAFSLADSALAFASNSYGRVALALENNISYVRQINAGDILTVSTEEISMGNRIGVYSIIIVNQDGTKAAAFRGTVFRTEELHFSEKAE